MELVVTSNQTLDSILYDNDDKLNKSAILGKKTVHLNYLYYISSP